MLFFTSSIFSQSYYPQPYWGTDNAELYSASNLYPFTDNYSINSNIMYSGPNVSIYEYVYQDGMPPPSTTYSYTVKYKRLSINDSSYVIYYCLVRTYPNYYNSCDNPAHVKTPDWASRVTYSAMYWLEIQRKLVIMGVPQYSYHFADGVGIGSATRYYYKGSELN